MTEYTGGHVQQCSAALRRCYSIQAKINDLRSNPATPNISPTKTPADLTAPPASKPYLPGTKICQVLVCSTLYTPGPCTCPGCIDKGIACADCRDGG